VALGRPPTWFVLAGCLALAPALPAQTLTLTLASNPFGGAVIPGTSSGTLILAPTPVPTGSRSVTGSTTLPSSLFALGSFTATGPVGSSYTVSNNATTGSFTLTGPSGATMTVSNASLTFASTYPRIFTASQPVEYFGLTVNVKRANQNPAGTYTGTVTLKLRNNSNAQTTTRAFTVTVKALASPITVAKTADLAMGRVAIGASAGTVTLAPTGTRTFAGGASAMPGGTFNAAGFTVTAPAGATYALVLPATATLTSGAQTLTLGSFTRSPSGSLTMGAGGTQAVTVGAQIAIPGGQAPGTYAGTFSVTVAYN